MSKENYVFKTLEIKSYLLKKAKMELHKLWLYIKDGNFNKFKYLVNRQLGLLESTDTNDNSLLNIAVQCNNYEITDYLIKLGAKINTQNVLKLII
jgi:hypothetical protein